MTHLDILVEPKRYDPRSHKRISTDFYYVASQWRVGILEKLSIQGRLMDE
jgi:hypothetical protein